MNHENLSKWQKMHSLLEKAELPSAPFHRLTWLRLLNRNLLVIILQYAGLMFTTVYTPVSLVWFASGTGLAFVFLRGYDILPGLWLGTALAYYFSGLEFTLAASCACVLSLQAVILRYLNFKLGNLSLLFSSQTQFIRFLVLAALICNLSSLILSALCINSLSQTPSFLELALQWSLANFSGCLILSTSLASWDAYFPDLPQLNYLNKRNVFLYYGAFLLTLSIILLSENIFLRLGFLLLNGIVLFKISRCYQWCGCIAALFMMALMLSLAVLFEMPHLAEPLWFWPAYLSFSAILGISLSLTNNQQS